MSLISSRTPTVLGSELLRQAVTIENDQEASLWLERILTWLAKDSATPGRFVRFKFLFQVLEAKPAEREAFFKQLARLFKQEKFLLRFFLQTGYSQHQGLLLEAAQRTLARILPTVRENDLFEIVRDVFHRDEKLVWLENIPADVLEKLSHFFSEAYDPAVSDAFRSAALEAVLVFALRIADLGLTTEIRQRSLNHKPSQSPFFRAGREFACSTNPGSEEESLKFKNALAECENLIALVYHDMEKNGASVGLVYQLEVMSAAIARIRLLLKIMTPDENLERVAVHRLIVAASGGTLEGRMIIGHIRQHTHLLSKKIAERNGASGDHYIARSAPERRTLFVSALKGGAIVLVMTLLKMTLHQSAADVPVLPQAALIWLIYSGGFIVMQLTDSTLATKLPSFTASKLAGLMNNVKLPGDLDLFVEELKTVLSSQTIAFLGNIASLIPLALAFNWLFRLAFSEHFVESHYATETLAGLHPLFSLAVAFGALTGVLLWISSLAGGWFENWAVYRKLPQALAENRKLKLLFGARLPESLSKWLEHNASGLSANVTLGFLFAFVPFIGSITGLPFDSRHVTISSASAVLSAFSVNQESGFAGVIIATVIGLLLIGIANLAVSFSLALVVAARASAVNSRRFGILLKLIRRRLVGL